MPVPSIIHQLVERFQEHSEDYRSGSYNETQLRRDFLDPFFGALGWDMTNRAGTSEQAREVIMEYSLKIEGRNKAPDYCFRSGRADKPSSSCRPVGAGCKDRAQEKLKQRRSSKG